jgi:Flp pilus assembly CpaF family ATPase
MRLPVDGSRFAGQIPPIVTAPVFAVRKRASRIFTLQQYVVTGSMALRMRPDRIFVGEVRGPEALDLLMAWNTGHEGGIASLRANSTSAALNMLSTLVAMHPNAPRGMIESLIGEAHLGPYNGIPLSIQSQYLTCIELWNDQGADTWIFSDALHYDVPAHVSSLLVLRASEP